MKEEKKEMRGGVRPGAGPKFKYGEDTVNATFRVPVSRKEAVKRVVYSYLDQFKPGKVEERVEATMDPFMEGTPVQGLMRELGQFSKFPFVDRPTVEAAIDFTQVHLELEKEKLIDLLRWRETRFTKEAPFEYVLSEFEKIYHKEK
jgi:hypothetical protein